MTVKAAFVFEQTLGHVTYYRNLRDIVERQSSVVPTWLPIRFSDGLPARALPFVGRNWSVQASWKARRAVTSHMRQNAPDVLFFHTQVTSLFSTDIMRRIPTVISLDATPLNFDEVGAHYGHYATPGTWLERGKWQLNQRAFHAAHSLICWSEWARQSLINDYGVQSERIHVIAPGANASFFNLGDTRLARLADQANEQRGPIKVLFVGGDFHRKGGSVLIEAMRGLLSEDCELHVVTASKVDAPAHVFVHSGVSANSPELLDLFQQADLFVLPSQGECLAVALMEATAAGLPVVTTRVGALGEAVHPEESGFLVGPGDVGALRRAILELIGNPNLRRRMSHRAYRLAREKFNAEGNGLRTLRLLVDVAETMKPTRRAA